MDIKGLLSSKIAGIPAWIIAAGAGVGVWYFFLRGKSSGSSSSSGAPGNDQAYGLGYAQGLQYAAGNVPGSPAPPVPPVPGPDNRQPQRPPPQPRGPGSGITPDGVGGFSSHGSRSSQWAGNYFHPAITRRVIYAHYVRAIGGPAAHAASVKAVAKASGIHEGRLQALNPEHSGRIRIA